MHSCVLRLPSLSIFALLACTGGEPGASGGSTQADASSTSRGETSSTGEMTDSSTTAIAGSEESSSGGGTSGGETSLEDDGDSSTTGEPTSSDCDALAALVDALPRADDPAAEVLAFLAEARYGAHGLPLRCDAQRVVFVAAGELPRSVAGAFNDWAALPMTQPVEGAPLWTVEVELQAPGGLYKFIEGEVFRADPLARRYGWDRFGEYSLVDSDPQRGHHERWPRFAEGVGALEPRDVRVFIPASVNAGEPAPVLYMHDGQNVFAPDALFGGWQASTTVETLAGAGTIEPVVIVAIDNTAARLDEYSHVVDDFGSGPIGGLADDYADFVVDGVVPFVESRYPVQTGREHTAVLGSSMGGLVSLHIAHRHPDVFGYAGSMSGTLGWGTFGLDNETMIERYAAAAPPDVVFYVDSGGAGPCPDGGSDNYCENVAFSDVLRSAGWQDDVDLFYRWSPGAGHNEAAWAARLSDALRQWFPAT